MGDEAASGVVCLGRPEDESQPHQARRLAIADVRRSPSEYIAASRCITDIRGLASCGSAGVSRDAVRDLEDVAVWIADHRPPIAVGRVVRRFKRFGACRDRTAV